MSIMMMLKGTGALQVDVATLGLLLLTESCLGPSPGLVHDVAAARARPYTDQYRAYRPTSDHLSSESRDRCMQLI